MDNLEMNLKYKNISDVKERINQNYQFMKALEKLVIYQESEQDKLRLIEWIAFLYSDYVTGQYASKELEHEIIAIGNRMIKFSRERQPKKNHILIVMTESGAVGGHSVLVNNCMRWDTENQYSVAFTGQNDDKVVDFIKESVSISGGEIFCLSGDYILKANKLLDISQDFEKILLFTHMYDVVPILAYGNDEWKSPVLFYNHANFRFSFGFSIADRVLELLPYDKDKTERFRGVPKEKSIVIPFPNDGNIVRGLEEQETEKQLLNRKEQRYLLAKRYGFNENDKLIVSAASDFKYENILGYEFDRFVDILLSKYNYKAHFLIIGADQEKKKWKRLNKMTGGKGRALGILPLCEMERLIAAADLYISSFSMICAGEMIAEKAGVPFLTLCITKRGVERLGNSAVFTIDELLSKSLDILDGNGIAYLGGDRIEFYENQKEWCSKWKRLLEDVNEHNITQIHPKRHIETEEIVNCQLMQDMASEHAAEFLYYREWNEQLLEQIFYLDNKYGMNIFHRIEILRKNIEISKKDWEISNCAYYSDKHLKLYLMAIKWVQMKQREKSIEAYLLKKNCHSVAIYGMSYMGETIYRELQKSSIVVLYGIDQNAEQIQTELKVYHPSEAEEEVDLIINSTTLKNQIVGKEMENLSNVPIVSIKEILDAE